MENPTKHSKAKKLRGWLGATKKTHPYVPPEFAEQPNPGKRPKVRNERWDRMALCPRGKSNPGKPLPCSQVPRMTTPKPLNTQLRCRLGPCGQDTHPCESLSTSWYPSEKKKKTTGFPLVIPLHLRSALRPKQTYPPKTNHTRSF